jgi:hypothetical protein
MLARAPACLVGGGGAGGRERAPKKGFVRSSDPKTGFYGHLAEMLWSLGWKELSWLLGWT